MAETAELATAAAAAVDLPGRPLAAGNAGVSVPPEPHLALWQALTTLREHRGDGHNAALVQRGIDGVAAHVLAAAAGRSTREWLQRARGWDDAAWDDGAARLTARGWLDGDRLSAEGMTIVAGVEADTDRLALRPWEALGDAAVRPAGRTARTRPPGGRRRGGVARGQPDRCSRAWLEAFR